MEYQVHMVTIEEIVPEEHMLRKVEASLDLSFVYEETTKLYSRRCGRPPIDPVVMVKYLLIGFLYGIESERKIENWCNEIPAFRWYLGLDLFDRVPDHSTISQLRRRKPAFRKVFRRLFEEVVRQCIERGLVSGRLALTDSTHVKANASYASEEAYEVPESPSAYWERLDTSEEEGLEELARRTGRRRKKRTKQVKKDSRRSHKRISRTDPEAGHLNRRGKPRGPHYLSHQTLDSDKGIIIGLTVTSGDVHDSVPYLDQIEHIHSNVIPLQAVAADSAYDMGLAHRVLSEHGIDFFVPPKKVHDRTKAQFKREAFSYDEARDVYVCPGGRHLKLSTLHRSASGLYWVYTSNKAECESCPLRQKCLSEGQNVRKIERSYFAPQRQQNRLKVGSSAYREALRQRLIWCEGTFAAQKWGHNLTRLLRRGLEAAEDHCLLSASAINLKRLIKHSF